MINQLLERWYTRQSQIRLDAQIALDYEWKVLLRDLQMLEDESGEWRVCSLDFGGMGESKGVACDWRSAAKILSADIYQYVEQGNARVMIDGFKLKVETPKGQTIWMWIEKN